MNIKRILFFMIYKTGPGYKFQFLGTSPDPLSLQLVYLSSLRFQII